jgi:type I restriction enzyme S subunit
MPRAEWRLAKLNELGFVGRGKSRHRPRDAEFLYGGPYPFFQTGDIKAANFHLTEHKQTYSEEGLAQSKLWKAGTLCITIAANIADSAILAIDGCFPDSVVGFIADPGKADVRFIKYSVETLKVRMQNISRGATQDNLSLDKLLTFDFNVPPLPMQRRIAGILSAYDELIENSQRRIQILEAMARALYREWFVEFRFPGPEKFPRVVSTLGEIPQGWDVKPLSEVCIRMESGGTPRRQVAEYWAEGDIDWFKTGELWDGFLFESEEKITQRGQRESNARLFESGTILMAIYGSPTVGRLGMLTRPSSCNQAALGIVANTQRISQTFLYFVLLSRRDHFNGLAQGAAQQNISKEKVANTVVLVPPRTLVEVFDRLVEPMVSQIQTLQRQVHNLHRTRDLLLPRLLSGQVAIIDTAA